MIHIVDRYNRAAYAALLMEMHRYRHDIYIKKREWAALRSYDGMEIDEYDGQNATYLVATDEAGKFQGAVRLISTAHHSMMKDHFAHIVFDVDTIPSSECVMEGSRIMVTDWTADDNGHSVLQRLSIGMVEYALSQGAVGISTLTERSIVDMMDMLEWGYVPLSPMVTYSNSDDDVAGSGECMAQYIPICQTMFKHIDRNTKIGESNFVIGDEWAKANLSPSDFLAEQYEIPAGGDEQALAS
ncbi:acyl-homoserine-lactone synthase [Kordiimonas sp. SCSIO 12610]|uniref:acyl-homoserine-lactone synthase n=1 Tax=Kordiimonas sp. SCSIO 12610 TaxID=2829597 RepID=UPI00210E3EDC|nr:acyl-homoserine-lactone synthase [Kordiimonas sp. SCSIO 12610]UTW56051.1 GNAT family N-acetyltransferase [Kordiimonas sp. SCSIO 12610]